MLVTAMFSCPALDWSSPGDSVELFAGDCSITRGEWKDHKLDAHKQTLEPSTQTPKGVNNQEINWAYVSLLGAKNFVEPPSKQTWTTKKLYIFWGSAKKGIQRKFEEEPSS